MDEKILNQETASFVERPWGSYWKLFQEPGVWVKRIEVKPGARLSLQKHEKRSEKWIVVAGEGMAVVNGQQIPVNPGSVVDIPLEAVHRIGNTGSTKLIFIEVACGSFLSENDITRLQDDYARP
jgi:mannose-6-phosphate isomerase-like protein (cupin superfamily)